MPNNIPTSVNDGDNRTGSTADFIDDPVGAVDKLADGFVIELRDNPATLRELSQSSRRLRNAPTEAHGKMESLEIYSMIS